MNNETNKLIPELRFPEFMNDGEWSYDKVGSLILTVTPPKKLQSSNYLNNGKYPIIDQSKKFYCGYTNDDDAIISQDYPLIVFGDHTCILKLAIEPFAQGADGIKIFKPKEKIDTEFLYHFLHFNEVRLEDYKRHFSILKDKYVFFPKLETTEQQKIADCLSSLDEIITAHTNKLETLKAYKKGLMQNLFPQEGEKVPKLRFKEFEKDGEWVEKKIKNIFSIFQGFAFSSDDSVSSGVRWLKIADVGIQQMKEENPSFLPVNFKKEYERFLVQNGDYVLALTRPILNMELKIARITDTFNNALLNQRVGKIVSSNCVSFIYYLLHTKKMINNINNNIAGNEPPNLSFQQIENILINIPLDIKEQKKIAETLSSIDDLIKEQSNKIEELKAHKKGLMQGLFPKMND